MTREFEISAKPCGPFRITALVYRQTFSLIQEKDKSKKYMLFF
jgi:hypothetical protein